MFATFIPYKNMIMLKYDIQKNFVYYDKVPKLEF